MAIADDPSVGASGEMEEMAAGCFEFGSITPTLDLGADAVGLNTSELKRVIRRMDQGLESTLQRKGAGSRTKSGGWIDPRHALVRLPGYDAMGEAMADLEILLRSDERKLTGSESGGGDGVGGGDSGDGSLRGDAEKEMKEAAAAGDEATGEAVEVGANVDIELGIETVKKREHEQEEREREQERREQLLQGLNSNSHSFPWHGKNTYPRLFLGSALVLRDACVLADGIAVSPPPAEAGREGEAMGDAVKGVEPREYHYGGCGCCPLGHGEIGKTFEMPNRSKSTMGGSTEEPLEPTDTARVRHAKVVSVVQRFQHVYVATASLTQPPPPPPPPPRSSPPPPLPQLPLP